MLESEQLADIEYTQTFKSAKSTTLIGVFLMQIHLGIVNA